MVDKTSCLNFLQLLFILWLIRPVAGYASTMMSNPSSNSDYYDIGFVVKFTKLLIERHKIEGFITYSANRKLAIPPAPQFMDSSLERMLAKKLQLPLIVWGLSSNITFWRIITHKTLVFATMEHFSTQLETLFEVLHQTLYGRHDVHIIFVIKETGRKAPNRRKLVELFHLCWVRNFLNVVVTYQQISHNNGSYEVHNELFSYTPFPQLTLLNVTGIGVDYEWPLFEAKNVHKYHFRIPVFPDPPSTYLLPNGDLRGITGSLISTFIHHINGTLQTEIVTNVTRDSFHDQILLMASRDEVDIGVHPYSAMDLNANQTEGAFSFALSQSCLIVPWQRSSALNKFMWRNINTNQWILYFLMLGLPLGWQLCARNASKGAYMALLIFYLQSLDCAHFRRFSNAYKMIHVFLLLGVFVQRNMNSADLSASFSVERQGPQINTVDDFLKTSLQIMLTPTQKNMFFSSGLLPKPLESRLIVVNLTEMVKHRETLNTSYAYFASSEYASLLDIKQQRLLRPPFRMAGQKLCTPPYFMGIPVQWNSPFSTSLFNFYLMGLQSGLEWKWITRSQKHLFSTGIIKVLQNDDLPFASLNLHDFKILLKMYLISLILCFLLLSIEMLWKRCVDTKNK